jgi:hypothetical protein
MKVAILVGVDTYKDGLSNLPACKYDVDLLEKVINATSQFTHVLCISQNATGSNVKRKISEFISDLKGSDISEIFFYFTGHGDFYDNQFYYVLSDFDTSKRKQTSLENTEVDNWLRSLTPKLTIKVVDACHSGITYIKSDSVINEHLEKSKQNFKDCYFMFSSYQDQVSYQDNDLSFFTRSFLKSLAKDENRRIRYKDIIDYISDEFDQSTGQTPIFITQGAFTDIFCTVNTEIGNIVNPIFKEVKDDTHDNTTEAIDLSTKTLEMIIKEDSEQFCSAEQVEIILENIKEKVASFKYSTDIHNLFDFNYSFLSHEDYGKLTNEKVIGNWLEKNSHEYFAKPTEDLESYEVEVPDHSTFGILGNHYRMKTKYRTIVIGFKNTAELSYDLIRISAEPKLPNIPPFNCTLVIILSKSSILIFYFFAQYREKNWTERELAENVKWHSFEQKLKYEDKIHNSINSIQQDFEELILSRLKERFNVEETQ